MRKKIFPLKLHDEGEKIEEAQRYLQKAGSTIKVSGIFTIGMLSAVKRFQKMNGLKVTGQIDKVTFEKLATLKTTRRKK